ncbi:MAG: hypothetical protein KAR06_11395 [Deltaproteobacteria bacterium]|nr:hypothetical protein [Deltaproteobacteria bacterium]
MKKLLLASLIFILAGCVTPPQTTQELREGIQGGARLTTMKEITVNRSFNSTYNSIKKNADMCFNLTVTSTTPGRYGPMTSITTWRSSSRKTGKGTAEMVIQLDARATGEMPPGGYFSLLVDTESLSSKKTKVTIYGASIGWGDVFESIFAWAEGKKQECPKKPFGGLGSKFDYHNK